MNKESCPDSDHLKHTDCQPLKDLLKKVIQGANQDQRELMGLKPRATFRAWDGEKWQYRNLFLSYDGKLWLRYDGRKLKEVDWKLEFNYKQDE